MHILGLPESDKETGEDCAGESPVSPQRQAAADQHQEGGYRGVPSPRPITPAAMMGTRGAATTITGP